MFCLFSFDFWVIWMILLCNHNHFDFLFFSLTVQLSAYRQIDLLTLKVIPLLGLGLKNFLFSWDPGLHCPWGLPTDWLWQEMWLVIIISIIMIIITMIMIIIKMIMIIIISRTSIVISFTIIIQVVPGSDLVWNAGRLPSLCFRDSTGKIIIITHRSSLWIIIIIVWLGDICKDLEMANELRVSCRNTNFRGGKGKKEEEKTSQI